MNYELLLVLLFALFSVGIAAENKKEINEECITVNDQKGKCVPLNQCQYINNATGFWNPAQIGKSLCGFDNETIVCCEHPHPVPSYNEEINNVLGISVCGIAKETERIFGGEETRIGEFPWLVGIEFKNKRTNKDAGILCGGSLINKNYVLTAANCIVNREFTPTAVRLGDWNIASDPDCIELIANKECADPVQKVVITKTIPHPYYSRKSGYNNIALIRLEKEIEFTDFVAPICLAHSNVPVAAAGMRMTVAGWGMTENGTRSDILLKTDVPVILREECYKKLPRSIGLNQLCAGGELGKDSCRGDTGGPLMHEHDGKIYQHGSVSAGIGCAAGYPAIYTNVSDYLAWIANIVTNYK